MLAVAIAILLTSSLVLVLLAASLARWCFEDELYALGVAAVLLGLVTAICGIAGSVAIASEADTQTECQP